MSTLGCRFCKWRTPKKGKVWMRLALHLEANHPVEFERIKGMSEGDDDTGGTGQGFGEETTEVGVA